MASKMQHMKLNAKGKMLLRRLREQAERNPLLFTDDDRLRIIPETPTIENLLAEICSRALPCRGFRENVAQLTNLIAAQMDEPNGQHWVNSEVVNPLGVNIPYRRPNGWEITTAIQRAGLFMLPGLYQLRPDLEMYFPWLARNHNTLEAIWKEKHLPPKYSRRRDGPVSVLVPDVVCAAGGSIVKVLQELNLRGYPDRKITIVCIMSAREGIAEILLKHPGVKIYIAKLSKHWLTDIGYILDGPGDAGDRCCGTV